VAHVETLVKIGCLASADAPDHSSALRAAGLAFGAFLDTEDRKRL